MNSRRTLWLAAALLILGLMVGASALPTQAQGSGPTDDEVNLIAEQLYCPVCENVPLDVCPTQACKQWRDVIRDKLAQGWSGDQIKAYFVDRYGERVLATPPATGLNWLVYIIPPLAILAGAVVLATVLRNWRTSASELEEAVVDSNDPYVEMLEEELRAREGS